MAIDFKVKDTYHKIVGKFVPAYLPEAKKAYNLKAVLQSELDIHGIASKASVYNIATSPKVIEEGFTAALELIYYLAADGYKIKTPLFNLRVRVPGEYDGGETKLPEGIFPEVRLTTSADFRNYIRENVQLVLDGIEVNNGYIANVDDADDGITDVVITIGGLISVHGYGLKVEGDADHANQIGVFFEAADGVRTKAAIVAVNEPKTLKLIVPATLTPNADYYLVVVTQSTVKNGAVLLKNTREVRSEFVLKAI
jgi:3D (Asp-Asp-Asp) domain-containing protein